jgi:hypothetical protein
MDLFHRAPNIPGLGQQAEKSNTVDQNYLASFQLVLHSSCVVYEMEGCDLVYYRMEILL